MRTSLTLPVAKKAVSVTGLRKAPLIRIKRPAAVVVEVGVVSTVVPATAEEVLEEADALAAAGPVLPTGTRCGASFLPTVTVETCSGAKAVRLPEVAVALAAVLAIRDPAACVAVEEGVMGAEVARGSVAARAAEDAACGATAAAYLAALAG